MENDERPRSGAVGVVSGDGSRRYDVARKNGTGRRQHVGRYPWIMYLKVAHCIIDEEQASYGVYQQIVHMKAAEAGPVQRKLSGRCGISSPSNVLE